MYDLDILGKLRKSLLAVIDTEFEHGGRFVPVRVCGLHHQSPTYSWYCLPNIWFRVAWLSNQLCKYYGLLANRVHARSYKTSGSLDQGLTKRHADFVGIKSRRFIDYFIMLYQLHDHETRQTTIP
jgi:hypothetical protein